MQQFHIREAVVFEDILPEDASIASDAMALTRTRMSLQQMLDDPPEDASQITRTCQEYSQAMDSMIEYVRKNRHAKLLTQPIFHWYVHGQSIQSTCWLLDSVMTKHVIATAFENEAMETLKEDVKAASKLFGKSAEMRQCAIDVLSMWTWCSPSHELLHKKWHQARREFCLLNHQLATLDVGISKCISPTVLFTVSQRAIRHAMQSLDAWPTDESLAALHVAESMRYLYSSNILWTEEKYGHSIYRMQRWLGHKLNGEPYTHIQQQLESVPFLLDERLRDNQTVYFHKVVASTPLAEPVDLMYNTTDIAHPACLEDEQEQDATHEANTDAAMLE